VVTTLRGNRRGAEGKIRSMCSVVPLGDVDTYRTPALSSTDALWLKDEGFTVAQTLVVLQRTGRVSTPSVPTVVCRNETSRHLMSPKRKELLRALLAIDAASFPAPWNLDAPAFRHACRATGEHRVVIANDDDNATSPIGYAIVGRVGVRSYLQRLAVAPHARRRGVAQALVHNASLWADSRGATTMLVNTEPTNAAALALYRSLGFDVLPDSFVVMERAVNVAPEVSA
jgi:GNAT superfamily N-acetyltransferase